MKFMNLSFTISLLNLDEVGKLVIKDHHTYVNPSTSNHICRNWAIGYDSDSKCHFTGVFDLLGKFYLLPIQIHYVQFDKILDNAICLVLYDKQFSKHKSVSISNLTNLLPSIQQVINYLNLIIISDYDIDKISERIDYKILKSNLQFDFLPLILKLNLEFYDVGISRVGKDNMWHEEIEVTNLPQDIYIREILNRSTIYDQRSKSILVNDKIVLAYNHDSGYCAVNKGRVPSKFNESVYKIVINSIIFNFYKFYSELEYFKYLISNGTLS